MCNNVCLNFQALKCMMDIGGYKTSLLFIPSIAANFIISNLTANHFITECLLHWIFSVLSCDTKSILLFPSICLSILPSILPLCFPLCGLYIMVSFLGCITESVYLFWILRSIFLIWFLMALFLIYPFSWFLKYFISYISQGFLEQKVKKRRRGRTKCKSEWKEWQIWK